MGWIVEILVSLVLFTNALVADVGCSADKETCDNSLQAMMEGRGTRQKKQVAAYPVCDNGGESQFCWWAIEVGNPRWKLYRNGMQPLIEYNIGPSCLDNNERHGFSFMNTTTTVLYNETAAKRFTKLSKSFQVIVDVFYFCCSSRSACDKFSKNLSDDQIINKLADQLLIYINVASDVRKGTNGTMCKKGDGRPMARLPGVDVCVFVAQTSSKVKVYTGPMLFNRFNLITKVPTQGKVSLASLALERRLCISHMPGNNDYAEHLKDGECWRYLSQDEYLLFCCCYESDHWCRYSADHSKDSIWKNNARYWPTNPELRAVYNFPFDVRNVTAKDWSYRDFVYSRPLKKKKRNYITDRNIRLWHCVTGNLSLKSASGSNHAKDVERVMRKDLPFRGRSCFVDVNVTFRNTNSSKIAESVALDYGHSDESCGAMTCRMKEPNCIDNLLDTDSEYINTRVRCCCSTNNLCNHKEGSNYRLASALPRIDFSKVCLGGVYAFFASVFMDMVGPTSLFCLHYLDFETSSERLMVHGETFYAPVPKGRDYASHYFNNSQELNFRAVVVFPLPRPQCERTYSRHIMQFGVVFCSSGFGALRQGYSCDKGYLDQMRRFANKFERPLCYEGWYKLDVRNSSGEMTKKKTTGSPLCFDEVMLIPDNMSVFVTSGTFHPYTDSLSLRLHSPSVAMVNGTIVYHIKQVCAPKNGKPCNGLRNVMHNLMPMLMGFFMDDNFELLENGELKMIPRAARLPSTCKGDDEKDIGCADTSGCFEYHSFDGREPLYGCIEDIPTIVKNDPPLSTVLHCRSMLWSAEEFICDGIMDASHADGVAGVLCCCKRKCPPPINENPTSLDVGFQPFQTYK